MINEKATAHFKILDGQYKEAIEILDSYPGRGDISALQPLAVAYTMNGEYQQAIIRADRALIEGHRDSADINRSLMYLVKAYSYFHMMKLELFDENYQQFKRLQDHKFDWDLTPSDEAVIQYFEEVAKS